ncbi:MAG: hypothetical protein Q8P89_02445 [bacterium]|nr:hypothetical protein [bacterium]
MSTGKRRHNGLRASVVSIGNGGKGCIVINGFKLSLPQKNRRVVDNETGFWRRPSENEQQPAPLKLGDEIYFNLRGRIVTSWISMNGHSSKQLRPAGPFKSKTGYNQ